MTTLRVLCGGLATCLLASASEQDQIKHLGALSIQAGKAGSEYPLTTHDYPAGLANQTISKAFSLNAADVAQVRYETRRAQAGENRRGKDLVEAFEEAQSDSTGEYCSRELSKNDRFTNILNSDCNGGQGGWTKSNILWKIEFQFQVTSERQRGEKFAFDFGMDFGYGGVLRYYKDCDDTQVAKMIKHHRGDMWWAGGWNRANGLDTSWLQLEPGCHRFELYGGEGCCDGAQSIRFKTFHSNWYDLSPANLDSATGAHACINYNFGSSVHQSLTKSFYSDVQFCSPEPQNPQASSWQDTFSTSIGDAGGSYSKQVTVTRLDQSSGWGQHLQLKCCYKGCAAGDKVMETGVSLAELPEDVFQGCWDINAIYCRSCPDCPDPEARSVCIRRHSVPRGQAADISRLMRQSWFTGNNRLGHDFDLYPSLSDALACTNRWEYCPDTNVAGRGFPGECGPKGPLTARNWQSSSLTPHVTWQYAGNSNGPCTDGLVEVNMKCVFDGTHRNDRLFRSEQHSLLSCKTLCMETIGCTAYSFSPKGQYEGLCMGCTTTSSAQAHSGFYLFELDEDEIKEPNVCEAVTIGPAGSVGPRTVAINLEYQQCHIKPINPQDPAWQDTFEVSMKNGMGKGGGSVTYIRTDTPPGHGWGQNLQVQCCRSGCEPNQVVYDSELTTNKPEEFDACWYKDSIYCRHCDGCVQSHQTICIRRLTDPEGDAESAFTLLTTHWGDKHNVLNRDFQLFSNLEDAQNMVHPWKYCNYNGGVGFPRDCGPRGRVNYQWHGPNRDDGQSVRWTFHSVHEPAKWSPCHNVAIGPSSSNSAAVPISSDVDVCHTLPTNAQDPSWGDEFAVSVDFPDTDDSDGTLTVTRTDSLSGWGQDLELQCCSSGCGSEELIYQSAGYSYASCATNYHSAPRGSRCSNTEYSKIITTEQECRDAAADEQRVFGGVRTHRVGRPAGCYYGYDQKIYFNTITDPKEIMNCNPCSSHVGGVCKGPENCPASTNSPSSEIHGDFNHPALWQSCWGKGTVLCRHCPECDPTHRVICYHRLTEPSGKALDPYKLFTTNFYMNGNELGVDFNLYSSFDEALTCENPWKFCNYAEESTDPVGFPRDCGPESRVNWNWQSETHGGKKVQWVFGKHSHECPPPSSLEVCHLVNMGSSPAPSHTQSATKVLDVRGDTQHCHPTVYSQDGKRNQQIPESLKFTTSLTPPGSAPWYGQAELECGAYCARLGYCCNNPEYSDSQLLSCAQTCMIRKRGASEEDCRTAVQDQATHRSCTFEVDDYTYDLCGTCLEEDGDCAAVDTAVEQTSAGGYDGCAITSNLTPAALTAVRQDKPHGWGFNVHLKCCHQGCGMGELVFETGSEKERASHLMNACWSKNSIYCRTCDTCDQSHQYLCYRRTTDPPEDGSASDNYELFANHWTSENNVLGTDFELYGSFIDAATCRNPWHFCNYDGSVGFPRDCGISSHTPYNWQNEDGGGGHDVKWYFMGVHEHCPEQNWVDPCQPISIGPSVDPSKKVDLENAQVCFPEPVNPEARGLPDTFMTSYDGSALVVTRVDKEDQGWSQHLQLECCSAGCAIGETVWKSGQHNNPHKLNACWQRDAIYCRACPGCADSHKEICMRRLTHPAGEARNLDSLIAHAWLSGSNQLHVDFELYYSREAAKAHEGAWQYCDFDQPGIGFPGNCAPGLEPVDGQWQSEFYVETSQKVEWTYEGQAAPLTEPSPFLCHGEEGCAWAEYEPAVKDERGCFIPSDEQSCSSWAASAADRYSTWSAVPDVQPECADQCGNHQGCAFVDQDDTSPAVWFESRPLCDPVTDSCLHDRDQSGQPVDVDGKPSTEAFLQAWGEATSSHSNYCRKQLDKFTRVANNAGDDEKDPRIQRGCNTGQKGNLLWHIDASLYESSRSPAEWSLRFGLDFGLGGFAQIDKGCTGEFTTLWEDYTDLWWEGNWNHADVKTVTFTPQFGCNRLRVIGAEKCCDGAQTIQFQAPSHGYNSWNDLSAAALLSIKHKAVLPTEDINPPGVYTPVYHHQYPNCDVIRCLVDVQFSDMVAACDNEGHGCSGFDFSAGIPNEGSGCLRKCGLVPFAHWGFTVDQGDFWIPISGTADGWAAYDNYCVDASGDDLMQTNVPDGDGSLNMCKVLCNREVSCSAVEWYAAGWAGSKCKHVLSIVRAKSAATGPRWQDAECHLKVEPDQTILVRHADAPKIHGLRIHNGHPVRVVSDAALPAILDQVKHGCVPGMTEETCKALDTATSGVDTHWCPGPPGLQPARCAELSTESACTASKDDRADYMDSPCVWCCGNDCTPGGVGSDGGEFRQCEPLAFLHTRTAQIGRWDNRGKSGDGLDNCGSNQCSLPNPYNTCVDESHAWGQPMVGTVDLHWKKLLPTALVEGTCSDHNTLIDCMTHKQDSSPCAWCCGLNCNTGSLCAPQRELTAGVEAMTKSGINTCPKPWPKYDNVCIHMEGDHEADLVQIAAPDSSADGSRQACQSWCEEDDSCSAIEWYPSGWSTQGHMLRKCFKINSKLQPATAGSTASRWRDAQCLIRPNRDTNCAADVTCQFTVDNFVGQVFLGDKELFYTNPDPHRDPIHEWQNIYQVSFEAEDSFLRISGHNLEADGCQTGGLQLICWADDNRSPWHGFTANTNEWKAVGAADDAIDDAPKNCDGWYRLNEISVRGETDRVSGASCTLQTADPHWGAGSTDCGALLDDENVWTSSTGVHVTKDTWAEVNFEEQSIHSITISQLGYFPHGHNRDFARGHFSVQVQSPQGGWDTVGTVEDPYDLVETHIDQVKTAETRKEFHVTLAVPITATAVRFVASDPCKCGTACQAAGDPEGWEARLSFANWGDKPCQTTSGFYLNNGKGHPHNGQKIWTAGGEKYAWFAGKPADMTCQGEPASEPSAPSVDIECRNPHPHWMKNSDASGWISMDVSSTMHTTFVLPEQGCLPPFKTSKATTSQTGDEYELTPVCLHIRMMVDNTMSELRVNGKAVNGATIAHGYPAFQQWQGAWSVCGTSHLLPGLNHIEIDVQDSGVDRGFRAEVWMTGGEQYATTDRTCTDPKRIPGTCSLKSPDPHWADPSTSTDCAALLDGQIVWGKTTGVHVQKGEWAKIIFDQPADVYSVTVSQLGFFQSQLYTLGDFSVQLLTIDGTWITIGQVGTEMSGLDTNGEFTVTLNTAVFASAARFLAGTQSGMDAYRLEEFTVLGCPRQVIASEEDQCTGDLKEIACLSVEEDFSLLQTPQGDVLFVFDVLLNKAIQVMGTMPFDKFQPWAHQPGKQCGWVALQAQPAYANGPFCMNAVNDAANCNPGTGMVSGQVKMVLTMQEIVTDLDFSGNLALYFHRIHPNPIVGPNIDLLWIAEQACKIGVEVSFACSGSNCVEVLNIVCASFVGFSAVNENFGAMRIECKVPPSMSMVGPMTSNPMCTGLGARPCCQTGPCTNTGDWAPAQTTLLSGPNRWWEFETHDEIPQDSIVVGKQVLRTRVATQIGGALSEEEDILVASYNLTRAEAAEQLPLAGFPLGIAFAYSSVEDVLGVQETALDAFDRLKPSMPTFKDGKTPALMKQQVLLGKVTELQHAILQITALVQTQTHHFHDLKVLFRVKRGGSDNWDPVKGSPGYGGCEHLTDHDDYSPNQPNGQQLVFPRAYVLCDDILSSRGPAEAGRINAGDIVQFDMSWRIIDQGSSASGKAQLLQGTTVLEGTKSCPEDGPGSKYFTGQDCTIDMESQEAQVSLTLNFEPPPTNAVIGDDEAATGEDGTDVPLIAGIVAAVVALCCSVIGIGIAFFCCCASNDEEPGAVKPVTLSPLKLQQYAVPDDVPSDANSDEFGHVKQKLKARPPLHAEQQVKLARPVVSSPFNEDPVTIPEMSDMNMPRADDMIDV